MKKLVVFHQYDPEGNRVGGIAKYVTSLISNFPMHTSLMLIGISSNSEDCLFQEKVIELGGRNLSFVPVCRVRDENSRAIIPVTLKFFLGALYFLLKNKIEGTFFLQRFEYVFLCMFSKNRKLLAVHNDLEAQLKSSEFNWGKAKPLFKVLFRWSLRYVDKVFSVNSKSVKYIAGFSDIDCDFLPTWPDPGRFNYVSDAIRYNRKNEFFKGTGVCNKKKVVCFIGRFEKQKNISFLADIINNDNGEKVYLLAGDGDQAEWAKNALSDKVVSGDVKFLGAISHEKVAEVLSISDLYISTSYVEGMSVALLEALKIGTPVVTTSTGESSRIIQDGINGMIVHDYNCMKFNNCVDSVLNNQSIMRDKCSESVEKFSVWSVIDRLVSEL